MALPLYTEAVEVFESLGNSRPHAILWINLGEVLLSFLGEYDEAASYLSSAAAYFRTTGDVRREVLSTVRLCQIDWDSGRRRLARRRLQVIIEQARQRGDDHSEIEARRTAAECASTVGDALTAIEHLDRALELIEENGMAMVLPHALAHRALASLEAGDESVAMEFADKAAAANKPESDFGLITAWRCGTVLRALGRTEDAADQFELAYRLLESNLVGLDADRAAEARNLKAFAAIIEDYERDHQRTAMINLPSVDAPTGRPLETADFVPVTWTISEPEDWDEKNGTIRRQNRIFRLCREALDQGAVVRVHDLADVLLVSERTVKRDLAELRSRGMTVTTRRSAL